MLTSKTPPAAYAHGFVGCWPKSTKSEHENNFCIEANYHHSISCTWCKVKLVLIGKWTWQNLVWKIHIRSEREVQNSTQLRIEQFFWLGFMLHILQPVSTEDATNDWISSHSCFCCSWANKGHGFIFIIICALRAWDNLNTAHEEREHVPALMLPSVSLLIQGFWKGTPQFRWASCSSSQYGRLNYFTLRNWE